MTAFVRQIRMLVKWNSWELLTCFYGHTNHRACSAVACRRHVLRGKSSIRSNQAKPLRGMRTKGAPPRSVQRKCSDAALRVTGRPPSFSLKVAETTHEFGLTVHWLLWWQGDAETGVRIATQGWCVPSRRHWAVLAAAGLLLGAWSLAPARISGQSKNDEVAADAQLQIGIELTRSGDFSKAIPHFLAAQGRVTDQFAVDFNLALCYVATGSYKPAIQILGNLARRGSPRADVYNLLAQAFVGNSQPRQAFEAFERSAALKPRSEKLYLLLADACMDRQDYQLGLDVVNRGLQKIPRSARLHYERAVFLSFLNQPGLAMDEFAAAARLAPGSAIAFTAAAQKALLAGEIPQAVQAARRGIGVDPGNHILLTILAEALIRSGAVPGSAEFTGAQAAAEKSVKEQPHDAEAQLTLGQLDVMANRCGEAIAHLEIARRLWPQNPAIYAHLAVAYRGRGETEKAQEMLAILATLNRRQLAQYKTASTAHKPGYTGLIPEPSPQTIRH